VDPIPFLTHYGPGEQEAMMARTHTTLDLDRDLLRDAAEALGTTRTTDTVHAALRDVVARRRRAWLAHRDFSDLEAALPDLRTSRVERPGELGGS
jgi:Arc/MetJ family transcription regulator